MKIKTYLFATTFIWLPTTVTASDDFSILIHGAAIHSDCSKGKGPKSKTCDFNNFNPGLGLAWTFWGDNDTGKLAVRGGAYKDSFSEMAVYGGLSYRKEWYFTEHAFVGLGLQAGYLDGSDVNGFAALPMATLGYKSVALEIGYAPKLDFVVGRKHVAVTTFSLRWTL
ncbi:hypothetical protein [Aeromonas enteropelogenes]|uniref:hypothetical protein n=1 Tax=Aeromonas enteropelogenes TaxID=29489 RepID=UPI003BA3DE48